jgi:hypothetical protein
MESKFLGFRDFPVSISRIILGSIVEDPNRSNSGNLVQIFKKE